MPVYAASRGFALQARKILKATTKGIITTIPRCLVRKYSSSDLLCSNVGRSDMCKAYRIAYGRASLIKVLKISVAGAAFICLAGIPEPLFAQNIGNADSGQTREWALGAINHAQEMRSHKDSDHGSQST